MELPKAYVNYFYLGRWNMHARARMALDLEDGEIEDGEIEDDEVADTATKAPAQKPDAAVKAAPARLEPPVIDASMTPRTRELPLPRRREPLLPDPPACKRLRLPLPRGGRPVELDEPEDDWAGNVEKAIRAAMEKEKSQVRAEPRPEAPDPGRGAAKDDEMDDRKDKKKKRKKKYKSDEETDVKKQKKTHKKDHEEAGRSDDVDMNEGDDEEMLYVRGASPMMKGSGSPAQDYHEYQYHERGGGYDEPYDSYGEEDSEGEERRDFSPHRRREGSPPRRGVGRGFKRRPMRGRGAAPTRRPVRRDPVKGKRLPNKRMMRGNQEQGRDNMCVFFLQGKCQKGDDCPYSHEVHHPRKLELCKFYLNNCCAKKDKCLYMHNDFPCKFYHMGLKCFAGDRCKFSHGHLSETMRAVLLKVSGKHLETAPKEILGDFPRLSREGANAMMFKKNRKGGDSRKIPSLFEIEVPLPVQLMAEEKSRRDSPSLHGTPVPSDDEEQDGCQTPMPSSPKSDSAFSNAGKAYKWDQDDASDQSRNLHIDEEGEGGAEQEPEVLRAGTLDEEGGGKSRRSSEKKSKRKRDGSSQQPGSSRVRSGDESGEEAELRRIHKEERHLKRRLKEESKRNAREEKRLRRSLREERRMRNALEKERVREGELEEARLEDPAVSRLQDEAQARSNSPWEEPEFNYGQVDSRIGGTAVKQEPDSNYGRVESQFGGTTVKQEPDFNYGRTEPQFGSAVVKQEPGTEQLYSGLLADQGSVQSEDDQGAGGSPDAGKDFLEQEFLQSQLSIKQEIPALDTAESGTDSDGASVPVHLPKKQRELFLRIQQQQREAESSQDQSEDNENKEEEAEEENWYSSDEEETSLADVLKNLSSQQCSTAPAPARAPSLPATSPAPLAPALGGLNLGDLSKIDISESVTRLLSSIRHASSAAGSSATQSLTTATAAVPSHNSEAPSLSSDPAAPSAPEQKLISPEQPTAAQSAVRDPRLLRDPRSRSAASKPQGLLSPSSADGRRADPRSTRPTDDRPRRSSVVEAPNVYANAITSPSQTLGVGSAGRADVDLRMAGDVDLRAAPAGDVDLRQSSSYDYGDTDLRLSSDVDLRKVLGLPFKPVPMHMPATEIDASLTSHPPIPYKVTTVTIPRPDYSKLKINPSDPQVFRDPRLRKLFKLPSSPPPAAATSTTVLAPTPAAPVIATSRVDPRRARAATQQPVPCQDPMQQMQQMQQPQPQMMQQQQVPPQQLPPVQPDMFVPMPAQPPMMMPGMMPDSMLPRPGPTPGLLGVAPPGFLGVPQMGFCPPPTPRFEEDDDDENEGGDADVDLRRMYGWEHQGRPGPMRGNRRRWRGNASNRRRRADHSTPA
ncbi:protein suppressor of sable isoform X2 [Bacillus rossius redtenbacheri]|uniref:protein suppressor of sable isoform X2 n=1 Tax=Bacillus rossius redtenbacheri TaxID=93214 RepID=UPI002FDE9FA9